MPEDGQKKNLIKWLLIVSAIFLLLILVSIGCLMVAQTIYRDKILPNIFIGNLPVGKMSTEEARKILTNTLNKVDQTGVTFQYNKITTTIMPITPTVSSDLSQRIITFDPDKAVNDAIGIGHSGVILKDWQQLIKSLLKEQRLDINLNIDYRAIKEILTDKLSAFNQPASNAKIIYTTDETGTINFSVQKEKPGQVLNFDQGLEQLSKNLNKLDNQPIILSKASDQPTILEQDALNINAMAQKIILLAPLSLKYQDNSWLVDKNTLASWLNLELNPVQDSSAKIIVGLNNETVKNYLKDSIAKQIDREPVDAKFKMENDRIVEFQNSQSGQKLNIDINLSNIDENLLKQATSTIALVVEEYKSQINTESVNNLGIKEIIGIGQSNFVGSPKNRRINIKTGATKLNGILIKPNEEFSLVKALGKIEASTGYLTELVIKENKTVPEFGGGLCQIGTTAFRAALATGLPITMRRNHSYRVSYYEPAGTDATIYDPLPDLRFINDTGNYILIQTRIAGDNLYFDFWGTKDGRIIEQTKPKITNIVKPQPAKLIETLDLKPGEKKCTEKAHNGADASFYYKVTYPNSEIKEKTFSSHYVPWREVCLIGVEKLSTDNTSTSTPTKIN